MDGPSTAIPPPIPNVWFLVNLQLRTIALNEWSEIKTPPPEYGGSESGPERLEFAKIMEFLSIPNLSMATPPPPLLA